VSEKNEMETLAEAAFWVTDAVKGRLGKWKVDQTEWTVESARSAYTELVECLATLKEAGFKDKPKVAERAPYTHNIRVGCFFKKIPDVGKRWVTLRVAERFGLDAEFEVHEEEPWTV
jgi:hypothetical protein